MASSVSHVSVSPFSSSVLPRRSAARATEESALYHARNSSKLRHHRYQPAHDSSQYSGNSGKQRQAYNKQLSYLREPSPLVSASAKHCVAVADATSSGDADTWSNDDGSSACSTRNTDRR